MRNANPILVDLLNNARQLVMADLYRISLVGGAVLRYTNADRNIKIGAHNLITNSANPFNGTGWSSGGSPSAPTKTAASPLFSGGTALKLTLTAANGYAWQLPGTFNSSTDTMSAIVEAGTAPRFDLVMYDNTAAVQRGGVSVNLSTGSVTAVGANTIAFFAAKLAIPGPNGGDVWHLWASVKPVVAGNGRRPIIYVYGSAGDTAYIHHMQLENGTNSPGELTVTGATALDTRETFIAGPVIERDSVRMSVGIEVDSLEIEMAAPTDVQVNGVPLIRFIAGGGLDGARIELLRLFLRGYDEQPAGTVKLFSGRVADVETTRSLASVTVNADTELLNVKVPLNVWQASCPNTLFDGACGVSKAAYTFTGTVTSNSTDKSVISHSLAQAQGYFDLGVITFTTGANAGVARTVKAQSSSQIQTIAPWPTAPQAGDQFSIVAGCNKTVDTCKNKFNNIMRFRGAPQIPVAETVT